MQHLKCHFDLYLIRGITAKGADYSGRIVVMDSISIISIFLYYLGPLAHSGEHDICNVEVSGA